MTAFLYLWFGAQIVGVIAFATYCIRKEGVAFSVPAGRPVRAP